MASYTGSRSEATLKFDFTMKTSIMTCLEQELQTYTLLLLPNSSPEGNAWINMGFNYLDVCAIL